MPVLPTTMPYLWRRHLGLVRAVLTFLAALLYLLRPALPFNTAIILMISAWLAWQVYRLLQASSESVGISGFEIGADFCVFVLCALHPSEQALPLSYTFYLYLLLISALLYSWPVGGGIGVAGAIALVAPSSLDAHALAAVLVPGTLAVMFAAQREQLQERLSAALRRTVLSRSEAELAREQERQRIADDFHDGPLQSFISFQMRLEIVRKLMTRDADASMRELLQLQDLGRAQVTELRAFVRGMQPLDTTASNVGGAIREAVEHFERDSGITTQLFCGDLSGLDDATAGELLQIVREALNNVRKHSKASRVSLGIESSPKAVEITVADDGSGFPFSGTYTLDELEMLRMGPRSIKRRVRTLNGDLNVESKPTEGSSLRIRIPVAS